jgi:hypothetical protein
VRKRTRTRRSSILGIFDSKNRLCVVLLVLLYDGPKALNPDGCRRAGRRWPVEAATSALGSLASRVASVAYGRYGSRRTWTSFGWKSWNGFGRPELRRRTRHAIARGPGTVAYQALLNGLWRYGRSRAPSSPETPDISASERRETRNPSCDCI